MEKKDLDRRVRALTTLTKDHEVADLAASHFDSEHPLPAVIFAAFTLPCLSLIILRLISFGLFCLFRIIDFLFLALLSQREGPFRMFLFLQPLKPPRLMTATMETKARICWKGPVQRRHLLLRFLKTLSWTRRGNVSKNLLLPVPPPLRLWPGNPSNPEDGGELFDFMDS
jgi:hypothetical protein